MKTAGEILSGLFDKQFVEKAKGYSKFFDSWEDITAKNGMPSAAAHSRIKEFDRGIILIEMDHPGWKQILQTKQSKLLNDFCYRFPEMDISGISFMLGYSEHEPGQKYEETIIEEPQTKETQSAAEPVIESREAPASTIGFDVIKDDHFKEKLMSIGATINEKEKKNVRCS